MNSPLDIFFHFDVLELVLIVICVIIAIKFISFGLSYYGEKSISMSLSSKDESGNVSVYSDVAENTSGGHETKGFSFTKYAVIIVIGVIIFYFGFEYVQDLLVNDSEVQKYPEKVNPILGNDGNKGVIKYNVSSIPDNVDIETDKTYHKFINKFTTECNLELTAYDNTLIKADMKCNSSATQDDVDKAISKFYDEYGTQWNLVRHNP